MNIIDELCKELQTLEEKGLRRRPAELGSPAGARVIVDGKSIVSLCSNDYLGLANHPEIINAAKKAADEWGMGSGASRLVCGTMNPHRSLERAIAEFKGEEDAVLASTGWMANHAAICSLVGKGDLVLCDKLNHASILDATRVSGARMKRYTHCDMESLEKILLRHRPDNKRCLIVTDSLFSMDGDIAPLQKIVELKKKYDAVLMIDEAHGTGVFGQRGRGVAEYLAVEDSIDVVVGTLSKAIGCLGGYITGSMVLCEYLRNTARPYIYTTALPPMICAAAEKSLEIIQRSSDNRQKLLERACALREELVARGYDIQNSSSQIIPIIIGGAEDAVAVAGKLLEYGYLVPAIRPPTVPPNTSRLRVSLSVEHTEEEISGLIDAIDKTVASLKTGR